MVGALRGRQVTPEMAWETLFEVKMGEEGKSEEEWLAEGVQQAVEVVERGMWKQRGSEAGYCPVVLLVEVGARGGKEEGGGSEKETRRMRQEMEGQRELQELLVLEESQEGARQD